MKKRFEINTEFFVTATIGVGIITTIAFFITVAVVKFLGKTDYWAGPLLPWVIALATLGVSTRKFVENSSEVPIEQRDEVCFGLLARYVALGLCAFGLWLMFTAPDR